MNASGLTIVCTLKRKMPSFFPPQKCFSHQVFLVVIQHKKISDTVKYWRKKIYIIL